MNRAKERDVRRNVSRRGAILGIGQLLLTGFLGGRLYQLQVTQNRRYQRLSDKNQFDLRVVAPPRGRIYDNKMRLIAGNAESFQLRMTPMYVKDMAGTLQSLSKVVDLPKSMQTDILTKAKKAPSFRELIVRRNLTQRELARLAIRSAYFPGVSFEKSLRRIYPQGALTCHVTGYVSPISSDEIEQDSSLRQMPDLSTGKIGVEYAQEPNLRGMPGYERIEVNARGRPIRVLRDTDPRAGNDLQLSIDIGVQLHASKVLRKGRSDIVSFAEKDVQAGLASNPELVAHITSGDDLILRDSKGRLTPPESGAVVVMDIHNGNIVSLVSTPMYDPNMFTEKLLTRDWRRLNNHPRRPLLNRATSGMYAPGSTFKMVVALAALEAGIISEKSSFFCKGDMKFGNGTFHCWRKGGHGHMDLTSALEQSCDVYFYEVALKTGIKRIRNMALRLGLGNVTGVDIPGEKSGIIPSHEWKLATHGKVWTPGETVVAAIGQGYVLATPLQLAVMTARIANGKFAVNPSLMMHDPNNPPVFEPLDIPDSALAIIRKGMFAVTSGPMGTARNYALSEKYGGMSGKTGTVQVKRITKQQRKDGITKNIDRPWKERDHALFVAYAPINAPKYAISVVVEHGGSGSSMAAPIARDIMAKTITELGV